MELVWILGEVATTSCINFEFFNSIRASQFAFIVSRLEVPSNCSSFFRQGKIFIGLCAQMMSNSWEGWKGWSRAGTIATRFWGI